MNVNKSLHPFLFFTGYRILSVKSEDASAVLNLCSENGISFIKTQLTEKDFLILCSFLSSLRLIKQAEASGLSLSVVSSRGIPSLLLRYRRRYGFFSGLIASVLLIFLSSSVIWDVRIDGARRLCESQVISLLEECGLSVGSRRSSLDVSAIENRLLILSDDVSWISVNIIGTVAEVEIRELELPEYDEEQNGEVRNLVASEAGEIVGFEDVKGNISAEIGDAVSKGQLLIGGIYGDEESGIRYTSATGKVFAKTERELSVSIPKKKTEKVFSDEVKYEKYLIFFKKRIKFFSNYRNLPTTCDRIVIEEYLPAPGGFELPFGVRTVRYHEYETREAERSEDELLRLAQYRLDKEIQALLEDGYLLKKQTFTEILEDGVTLRCKISCVKNIAVPQKIEIDLPLG